jgi:hypothetical protein
LKATGTNRVPEEIAVKMSEKLTGKAAEKGSNGLCYPSFSHISSSETSAFAGVAEVSDCEFYFFMNLTV